MVGLDPKDTAADAVSMRRDHLGAMAALDGASMFVRRRSADDAAADSGARLPLRL